jgi:hypothetical protein
MGRVVIHTEPLGARIRVNGKETSYRTPVNFALAPGVYEITVEHDGFSSVKRHVVIEANRSAQVRLELERRRSFLSRLPFVR